MKKYVLDTNVVLHDAEAIYRFEEHLVIIPMIVLEELDNFKREVKEIGRNARAFSRYLDELRDIGKLVDGVEVNTKGGIIRVIEFSDAIRDASPHLDYVGKSANDNKILAIAHYERATLVSKDTNLRIKADCHGVPAEDYKNDKTSNDESYSGDASVWVYNTTIDQIYDQGFITLADMQALSVDKLPMIDEYCGVSEEPFPNQCFKVRSCNIDKQSALMRYDAVMKRFKLLPQDMKTVDINPRNTEQQFALDILKDDSCKLVTMIGKAGSGKTLLALAAGIHAVLELALYDKILLLKPIVSMDNGHELGFMPGTMEEKLAPWMASFSDNIEVIMKYYVRDELPTKPPKGMTKEEWKTIQEKKAGKTNPIQELIAMQLLEMGSLEHFRGRSLNGYFIIVDEVQNCTKKSIKTIITRAGEGTKVVLMGDTSQIDDPYLDELSNGLSIVVEAFKPQKIHGHITMRKSERSELAELAADLL